MQLRYPEINASNTADQVKQIASFLRQLVDSLNIEISSDSTSTASQASNLASEASSSSKGKSPVEAFNDIKGLIIKSADIIDAHYDVMNKSFSGMYVAQSEFGKYVEETGLDIILNSEEIKSLFNKTETIDVEDSESVRIVSSNAWVKIGVVDRDSNDTYDIYGIEIGQTNNIDGVEVNRRYATYTSEGVSLYDGKGNKTLQLINGEVVAEKIKVERSIKIGKYREYVGSDGSIIDRWEG